MSDLWKKTIADVNQGSAEYKKAKAKKDKVIGLLNDITKLHLAVSHLLKPNAKTSSELLELGYEGVQRLANKFGGNAPILQFVFRYHQLHVDLFAEVLQARNEANIAIKWQRIADMSTKKIKVVVDNLVANNGFAGPMLDQDGKLSSNVPRAFQIFCDFEAHDTSTDALEALQLSKTPRSKRWMDYERDRLGLLILENARDIAGAYLAVQIDSIKFMRSTTQASKYFKKLKKSKTNVDGTFGSGAERAMQLDAVRAGGTEDGNRTSEEVEIFISGYYQRTPSWKRMGRSYREMKDLAETWQKWAKYVAGRRHMTMY